MEHIQFGQHDFSSIQSYFYPEKPSFILLCDSNTAQHCKDIFLNGASIPTFIIEPGDFNKNLAQCEKLWDFLMSHAATRKTVLINLGGGMVSDLGGFAASMYMRGIRFVNVPTSLLAMVDATVGAKTGINFKYSKNILGSFVSPEQIFLSTNWLKTLAHFEVLSGKAEMLKHALIQEPELFFSWANSEMPTMADIQKSIQLKWNIVEKDPFEKGLRKCLNFGHTAGHAIESILTANGRSLPHGICVIAGIIIEMKVSEIVFEETKGIFDIYIEKLISIYGKIDLSTLDTELWLSYLQGDKKNAGILINPALLKNVGEVYLNQIVAPEIWLQALKTYMHDC